VTIKNNIIKLTVTFVFFILVRPLFSQETLYHNKNVGFNIGANCAIGSHFQRFAGNPEQQSWVRLSQKQSHYHQFCPH
jgi:hypothetical protein